MILLNIGLTNPWAKYNFKNVFCREKKLTKNKAYGIELTYNSTSLVSLELSFSWRGHDHAGPSIELGLFGWCIHLHIYDTRHWNYEKNCWESYNE